MKCAMANFILDECNVANHILDECNVANVFMQVGILVTCEYT